MIFRKILIVVGTLGLVIFLSACSPEREAFERPIGPGEIIEEPIGPPPAPVYSGDENELVIYIKPEYLDPVLHSIYEESHGVEITEYNFTSNEEIYGNLIGLSSTESYGVVFPSNYIVRSIIERGLLARLDHSNIPNIKYLSSQFSSTPADPGHEYCVPYLWGTTGFGYDSGVIQKPTSWGVIFNATPNDPVYGRFTILDDPREAFSVALIYLGYSVNTTNESELEQAKTLLLRANKGLNVYDSETYDDLIASGETILAHGWNGEFLAAQEVNENLLYSIPKEGGVIWTDYMCIPGTASPQKKALAETFINFLLDPEISAQNSEYTYLATPNEDAKAFLNLDILENTFVYPSDEELTRLQFIVHTGGFEQVYEQKWEEVKNSAP